MRTRATVILLLLMIFLCPQFSLAWEENASESIEKNVFILEYSMAQTVGSSLDYMSEFSFGGFGLEYRYRIVPQFSVGLTTTWNAFAIKKHGTTTKDNLTVTGTQLRRLSYWPISFTAHAYVSPTKVVLPFVGFNLGAYYVDHYITYGWFDDGNEDWHFGVAPELGLMFPFSSMAVIVSSKFHYLLETHDGPKEQFFSFNVGYAFMK